jgi:hypothetical protein
MLVIVSSSACVVALTWGGVQFPWSSARVLVSLILCLLGLAGFVAYDAKIATHPIVSIHSQQMSSWSHFVTQVPFSLLSTATGISGYLQTFFMPIALTAAICQFSLVARNDH